MKSKALLPLALGLFLVGTACWPSDAWSVILGGRTSRGPNASCALPDGGAVIAGSIYLQEYGERAVWVARLDADGQLLWEKAYRNDWNGYATQVAALGSGELLVSGVVEALTFPYAGMGFVAKLDASGNRIWNFILAGEPNSQSTSICPLSDGGCLVAGWFLKPPVGIYAGWIARLSASGALLWREMLPGLTSVGLAGGGGRFVLTGSLNRDPPAPWLALMDGDGHLEWQREFAGGTLCAAPTPDGGVVAVNARQQPFDPSQTWTVDVIALGGQGEPRWQRAFHDLNRGYDRPKLAVLPDGKIVTAVATDMFSPTYGDTDTWLLCLDPAGRVLWQNLLGQTGADDLSLLAATPDGGLVCAGHPSDSSTLLPRASWLLRTPPADRPRCPAASSARGRSPRSPLPRLPPRRQFPRRRSPGCSCPRTCTRWTPAPPCRTPARARNANSPAGRSPHRPRESLCRPPSRPVPMAPTAGLPGTRGHSGMGPGRKSGPRRTPISRRAPIFGRSIRMREVSAVTGREASGWATHPASWVAPPRRGPRRAVRRWWSASSRGSEPPNARAASATSGTSATAPRATEADPVTPIPRGHLHMADARERGGTRATVRASWRRPT